MHETGEPAGGPLSGVRVVDLTTVVMGPWTTAILAGYGASVIKVEPPEGDILRAAGAYRNWGMGSLFLHINRGKRGIVLDLKRPRARDALLRLCARADVVIHNIRPAAMRRLALGYDDVAAVNPKIIYVNLVGYAQDGPYAAKPAYDEIIQGASGLAASFRLVDGGEPRYVPLLLADRVTGMYAAHAVLAALFHRERRGTGQEIEVPMFETMGEFILSDHLGGLAFEPPAGEVGYNRILTPNRRPFRTLDGYVAILLYTDRHWERFFDVVGEPETHRADPRLHDPMTRRANYGAAYGIVADILATRSSAAWLDLLGNADIPIMPVNDVADLLDDPHLRATSFFGIEQHPSEGMLLTLRAPARWSAWEGSVPSPAPRLGEHTREVLSEAGLDAGEIVDLLDEGAAVAAAPTN